MVDTTQIDHIFERYTEPGSPGCAVAVIKDGDIIHAQGYGLANLELDVPITPETVFNIGSMAKQFTAFATVLLAAEGRLSLDDDIREHLPEMHDFGQAITLRHLIHHTSGIRDSFPALLSLGEWREADYTTTDDVLQLLNAQRDVNFDPGDEFEYANSNYVLLAQICARVSGKDFAKFCEERIFAPLAMYDTCVNASPYRIVRGRAMGYYGDDEAWYNAPLTDSVVGPTNVYTHVLDLAKWDRNFTTSAVGGEVVIRQMQQPGRLNNGERLDYAYGLEVGASHQHRGWQMVEHGGSQGGYASWMARFPDAGLSVIVLCNLFQWTTREYVLKIADLLLENRAPSPTGSTSVTPAPDVVALEAAHLAPKAGLYFSPERGALRVVTYKEGRLQFEDLDLVPVSENTFVFEVEPQTQVIFAPAGDGVSAGMKTVTSSGEYCYARVEPVTPEDIDLAAYAGRYTSPELDITWTIVPGDDCLTVRRRKYVDSHPTPLFNDAFRDDWAPLLGYPRTYLIRFTRDAHGAIEGLTVSGDGVRNLRFERTR